MNVNLKVLNLRANLSESRGQLKLKLPQNNLHFGLWQVNLVHFSYICKANLNSLVFISTNFLQDSKINLNAEIEIHYPTIIHCLLKGNLNDLKSVQCNEQWIPLNNFSDEIIFFVQNPDETPCVINCDLFMCFYVRHVRYLQ